MGVLGLFLVLPRAVTAHDAYGRVQLKHPRPTIGRLESDTLLDTRGAIAANQFAPMATDQTEGMSLTWMLPTDTGCPLEEPQHQREASMAQAVGLIRELLPELRQQIDVKAYVVPMLVRFRHKAGFDLAAERLTLEFGMSVPCGSGIVTADLLSLVIHELTHVRAWSRKTPNRFSNEAIAHSVHAAAWWRMRGQPPDFREFPYETDLARFANVPWQRLFRGSRPLSDRAGRVAQFALASLPPDATGRQIAGQESIAAYVRCLLEERPDFRAGNPAATWAATSGATCTPPPRQRQRKLAGVTPATSPG